MSDETWIKITSAILAAVPATIAAYSSLRNGRVLRNGHASKPGSGKLDISRLRTESGEKRTGKFGRD